MTAGTVSNKRALSPSTPSTPPTSPAIVKRIRVTYSSTNKALKALNLEKEEASLSHTLAEDTVPQLIEIAPKGKGRYKLQWDGKDRSFLLVGSIGKRADPNSVRPGTRPIGRYAGRVSGWECCHPLRIGHSSGGLRCRQNPTRVKLLKVGRVTMGGRATRCNGRIVK